MAMKCFQVVKAVLDATYDEISGDEATRDAAIATAISTLSSAYRNLLVTGGPDFTDPVVRFAYVYSYVPAHAHWVCELLEKSKDAAAVFDASKVRITCIGGGSGSDLVGILKFLDDRETAPSALFCEIVDGCEEWKSTWSDLAFNLDLSVHLNSDYVIHRVGEPDVWTQTQKFARADLFSLSFFVSEIAHLGTPAWLYLEKILRMAKPGAFLLFNDNNTSSFYEPFDQIAARTGWRALIAEEGDRRIYDPTERTDDLQRYKAKFSRTSRLTGNMAWRVLHKS